jgi:hypothetical protein
MNKEKQSPNVQVFSMLKLVPLPMSCMKRLVRRNASHANSAPPGNSN